MANYPEDFTESTNNTLDQFTQLFKTDNAAVDSMGVTPVTTTKINNLQQKKQQKINNLSGNLQQGLLLGMEDADGKYNIDGNDNYRLSSSDRTRYDAVELKHGNHPYDMFGKTKAERDSGIFGKSTYAMQKQREEVASITGTPIQDVTEQDMIDVGNMQQIQALSDMVNADDIAIGKDRWRAPLIHNVTQTNLTGRYIDDKGEKKNIPLNVPVSYYGLSEKGTHGRNLINMTDTKGKISLTDTAAHDPLLNAFANAEPNRYYHPKAIGVIPDDTEYEDTPLLGRLSTFVGGTAKSTGSSIVGSTVSAADAILNDLPDWLVGEGENLYYDNKISEAQTPKERETYKAEKADALSHSYKMNALVSWLHGDGFNDTQEYYKDGVFSKAADKLFNVDTELAQRNQKEIEDEVKQGNYGTAAWKAVTDSAILGNVIGSVIMYTTGVGEAKAGAMVAKNGSKVSNLYSKFLVAEKAGKAKEAAKYTQLISKRLTLAQKVAAKAIKNAGATALFTSTVNEMLGARNEATGLKHASIKDVAIAVPSAALETLIGLESTAIILKPLTHTALKELGGTLLRKATDKLWQSVIKTAGRMLATTGKGAVVESTEEYLQQWADILGKQFSTGKKGDDLKSIVTNEKNRLEAKVAGIEGIAGAHVSAGIQTLQELKDFGSVPRKPNNDNLDSELEEPNREITPEEQVQDAALDKLHTYLHNNGESLTEEEKPLAHASTERHLNNTLQGISKIEEALKVETDKEIPDTEVVAALEQKRLNLEDKVSILLDMRNHVAKEGTVYNNRPLKEIDKDLTQIVESLDQTPEDPKLIKKKRQLLLERYVASHPLTAKVNEKGEDTVNTDATFDTVLSQKLYGGSTKDGYRTGIMNMVSPLLDDSVSEVGKQAVTNNVERFLKSQIVKEKAIEAAKTEFEDQGKSAEEDPTPIVAEYFTPTGEKATFEYRGIKSEKTLDKIKKENEFLYSILHYASNPTELETIANKTKSPNQPSKPINDNFFDVSKGEPRSDYALDSEENIGNNRRNRTNINPPNNNLSTEKPIVTAPEKGSESSNLVELLDNKDYEEFSKEFTSTVDNLPKVSEETLKALKNTKDKPTAIRMQNINKLLSKLTADLSFIPYGNTDWTKAADKALSTLKDYQDTIAKIPSNLIYNSTQKPINTDIPSEDISTKTTNSKVEPNVYEDSTEVENIDTEKPKENIKEQVEVKDNTPIDIDSTSNTPNTTEVTEATKEVNNQPNIDEAPKDSEVSKDEDKDTKNIESDSKEVIDEEQEPNRQDKADIRYKDDITYKDPVYQKERNLVNDVIGRLQRVLRNYEKVYKNTKDTPDITAKAKRAKLTRNLKKTTGIRDIASKGKVKERYFYENLNTTIKELLEDIDTDSYVGNYIIDKVNEIRPNSKIGTELLKTYSVSKTIGDSLETLLTNEVISEDVVNSIKEIAGCN